MASARDTTASLPSALAGDQSSGLPTTSPRSACGSVCTMADTSGRASPSPWAPDRHRRPRIAAGACAPRGAEATASAERDTPAPSTMVPPTSNHMAIGSTTAARAVVADGIGEAAATISTELSSAMGIADTISVPRTISRLTRPSAMSAARPAALVVPSAAARRHAPTALP